MHWSTVSILLAAIAAVYVLQHSGQISSKKARTYLENGALVIDVRTAAEFNSGHLPNALNLPVQEIEVLLPRRVQDTNKPLLLYCQSGMRSGMAKRKLKSLGYVHAYNLGSYGRATRLTQAGTPMA
jgi:phage shock protein E